MMNRSNIGFAAMGLLLAGSSIWVTVRNYQLRGQLAAASATINTLSAGAFGRASGPQGLRQPVVLIPLGTGLSGPKSFQGKESFASTHAQCERCSPENTKAEKVAAKGMDGVSAPALSLLEVKNRYLPGDSESEYTLFVFFSPTDCPACLRESAVWQRLFQERDHLHLSVVGVVGQCSREEAEMARRQLGITFPLLFDVNSVMATAFGLQKTPEKILLDRHAKVVLASPAYQKEEMQRLFEHTVRQRVQARIVPEQ
jgi:peroxiredoxin